MGLNEIDIVFKKGGEVNLGNIAEVVLNLDESQRFVLEDPDSLCVIMVDKITIHPVANQIVYSGYSFDVDYKNMDFLNKKSINMVCNTNVDCIYSKGE